MLLAYYSQQFLNSWSQYAVKVRRHTPWSRVRCHGSHECWFTHSQFHSQFHLRWHSLRITLKYTTLVHMRSGYVWTMKSWQRSEWRLGFKVARAWCETMPVCSGLTRLVRPGYFRHYSGASRERARITRRAKDGSVHMQRSLPSSSYPARSTLTA